jgi:hypothetical protein
MKSNAEALMLNENIKTRKMYRDSFFTKVSLTPLLNEVIFWIALGLGLKKDELR